MLPAWQNHVIMDDVGLRNCSRTFLAQKGMGKTGYKRTCTFHFSTESPNHNFRLSTALNLSTGRLGYSNPRR